LCQLAGPKNGHDIHEQVQLITSATGKGITQATVYTNPLFYYSIKLPEQQFQYKLRLAAKVLKQVTEDCRIVRLS
jgi:hypothetical protein